MSGQKLLLSPTQAISAAVLAPTLALEEVRTTGLESKDSCLQAHWASAQKYLDLGTSPMLPQQGLNRSSTPPEPRELSPGKKLSGQAHGQPPAAATLPRPERRWGKLWFPAPPADVLQSSDLSSGEPVWSGHNTQHL